MTIQLVGLTDLGGSTNGLQSTIPAANIPALRLLTSATLPSPSYIDVASYYAASGTAPDGGGGLMAYDSTDTTTADNGFTVFVDASNRRWKRVLNGALPTLAQIGAKTDGTDQVATVQAAMTALGTLRVPPIPGGTYNFLTPLIIPSNTGLIGDSVNNTILSFGPGVSGLAQLNGSDITLENLQISGAGPDATIYSTGLNLQRAKIKGCLIYNFKSPGGNAVAISSQITNFEFEGNTIQCTGFGFLFNITANAGDSLRIINNYISAAYDAIEINTPTAGFLKKVTISGNICSSTASFGIGWAAARQGAITGNISFGAIAGIHLEDALSDVTVTSNIIQGPLDGLWINQGPNAIPGTPLVASNNVIRSTATPGTSGSGIVNNNNAFGTNQNCIFTGNQIFNFARGMYLNGASTTHANNNYIEGCPVAIRGDGPSPPSGPMRVIGTNTVKGATTGALLPSGARCGKLIFVDACPTALLTKAGSNVPGATLEGFEFPISTVTIGGAGTITVPAFPISSKLSGTLTYIIGNGGSSNSVMRRATVKWDGTTFTETLLNDADVGALAGAASTVTGGNLNIVFTSSGLLTGYSIYVDFEGDYYQA